MVLIPGLGPHHTGSSWHHRALQRLEVARLARSFTVWIIARPSALGPETTIKTLADQYAAAISSHFPEPVDVIGVSTGGSIALQLAIEHPHITQRLVLVSAAFRLGDEGRTAQRDIAEHLRSDRPRRAAARMLATTTTSPRQRNLLRATGLALGRLALGAPPADLIAVLEAEDDFDVDASLPRVIAPTLVLGGGRDGYYPLDLFTRTTKRVATGTFVHFSDKSHLGLASSPAVTRTITDYLKATPNSPA